ncbi:hypothetical protein MPSEU_000163000 [Mayamaea pseudoterrestris]|nr:hypothetical protein MPSEU_000163000 [Mayamaea pseudoterrestris]
MRVMAQEVAMPFEPDHPNQRKQKRASRALPRKNKRHHAAAAAALSPMLDSPAHTLSLLPDTPDSTFSFENDSLYKLVMSTERVRRPAHRSKPSAAAAAAVSKMSSATFARKNRASKKDKKTKGRDLFGLGNDESMEDESVVMKPKKKRMASLLMDHATMKRDKHFRSFFKTADAHKSLENEDFATSKRRSATDKDLLREHFTADNGQRKKKQSKDNWSYFAAAANAFTHGTKAATASNRRSTKDSVARKPSTTALSPKHGADMGNENDSPFSFSQPAKKRSSRNRFMDSDSESSFNDVSTVTAARANRHRRGSPGKARSKFATGAAKSKSRSRVHVSSPTRANDAAIAAAIDAILSEPAKRKAEPEIICILDSDVEADDGNTADDEHTATMPVLPENELDADEDIDDVVEGETLTCEQVIARKFQQAMKENQVITLD